jgi:GNAT superfamily N-acetyltransferase
VSGAAGSAALRIVPATPADIPLMLDFIRELAEYERLVHEVLATEALLRQEMFGARPVVEALIARVGDEPAGWVLFFHNFSTFLTRRGIYLEDLYVRPRWRGAGIGRALLTALARTTVDRGGGRLEWSVLDWNEPAIRFYHAIGAEAMDEWTTFRLSGDALTRLADEA